MKTYPRFIIFGPGNYNTLGVLRQTGRAGIDCLLLIVGSGRNIKSGDVVLFSRYARQWKNVASEQEGLDWLLENLDNFEDQTIIYTTSDEAERLLDENYDRLKSKFCFPNAGKQGQVSFLMNKEQQIKLAAECGLDIIKGQYTNSPDFKFDNVEYPCMIKPFNSTTGTKDDMAVCNNLQELKESLAASRHTKDFIVEKYLEKEYELLLLGVALPDGRIWTPAIVHKYDLDSYGDYTRALVTTDVEAELPELKKVHSLIKALGYTGPFSVEFGHEKGINYFFEVNLRNDGTSHYPLNMGINFAEIYYKSYQSKNIEIPTISKQAYLKVNDIKDIKRMLQGKDSPIRWLRDFFGAGSYRYYQTGDNRMILAVIPMFVYYYGSSAVNKILRIFKK